MSTIQDIRNIFAEFLYLDDLNMVDVILACAVANQLPGDAVSMYIIGPPSSAKTEILRSLKGYYRTYHPSKITPATLFSGYVEPAGRKGKPHPEKSAVKRMALRGQNIIVFKDFTTILTLRHEHRQEIITTLREVADGYYEFPFGTGEEVAWSGKIGIITGVTPAIDEYNAVNQVLGERFLCFRGKVTTPDEVSKRVFDTTKDIESYRAKTQEAVGQFLVGFEAAGCDLLDMSPEIRTSMISLVGFISKARTGIVRDRSGIVCTPPLAEGPARVARQLQSLASGLSIVRREPMISDETYRIIKKVARDSVHPWRIDLLMFIYSQANQFTTLDLVKHLGIPYMTAKRHLEDLEMCDLIKFTTQILPNGQQSKKWYISPQLSDYIIESGIFINDYIV